MSWSYTYDPHLWPPLITAILTAMLGWYGWQRRNFSGSKPFIILCLFAFFWAVGSIFETTAIDFPTKVFWIKFQAMWQIPAATALLWFVLEFAGFGRWLTRRNLLLMLSPSLLTLLLIITNDYHHLIWAEFQMGDHVIQIFGIANWILSSYAFMLILTTAIVLFWLAIRSPNLRWPTIIMLLGMVIGFGFYSLANIGVVTLGPGERVFLILGPLSLSYALAFFRFHIIDPVPAARTAALEQMHDGLLVLDLNQYIVDLNHEAANILGMDETDLRGRSIKDVFTAAQAILAQLDKIPTGESEISLEINDAIRYYYLNITSLTDRRGDIIGQLFLLHDVTEQKRAQAKVIEQQRVMATLQERERLARELHDSTSQVLGYVNLQAQAIQKWLQNGDNEKAEALVSRLAEIAKDAHADVRESILGLRSGGTEEWAFLPVLKRYLGDFQSQYNIPVELSLSNHIRENTLNAAVGIQVLRVIQEALTNARKHSGANKVHVSFEEVDDRVFIRITDDGSGFDMSRQRQDMDSHFGLTFMRERMAEIGGSLKIESGLEEGTLVEIEVPVDQNLEELQ